MTSGLETLRWPEEPSPSPYAFADAVAGLKDSPDAPDVRSGEGPDDLVATGADLEPGTLLDAYRHGLFPMPLGGARSPMGWWSPVGRGVLEPGGLRVSRSLRRASRDFEIRVDTAFEDVVAACADPHREHGWIDRRIARAYGELHRLGWAHSVEAWRDGRLEGGLYGVAVGGLFAGESMFHRARDASKVALVGLVDLLDDEHADDRLVDVQWRTPHLASLGVVELPRSEYLARLAALAGVPLPGGLVAAWQARQGPPVRRGLPG